MFLIYDTETTGLITTFDQITEFASIACDEDFNIIDQHEFNIRLSRDAIPAIGALNVTPNLPSLTYGLYEYEAIEKIHHIMSSQAYNGGYNTLRFDDEILRFSFYRHGLNPYKHQNIKHSHRFDLLPALALFYLIHPTKISWPTVDNKISLKLELLNKENAWKIGDAHRALFDVEVTLELMKTLSKIDKKLLKFALSYSHKSIDQSRCESYLLSHHGQSWAYLLDTRFGAQNQYTLPYYYQGPHPVYANQSIWQSMSDPEKIIRKKWGESPWVLPQKITSYLNTPMKEDSVTPYEKFNIEPLPKLENPHCEADLYASSTWYTHSPQTRKTRPEHLWRYRQDQDQKDNLDFHAQYSSYLLTGEPSQGYDHLGRARRHMKDIDPNDLNNCTQDIKNLYDQIRYNISSST